MKMLKGEDVYERDKVLAGLTGKLMKLPLQKHPLANQESLELLKHKVHSQQELVATVPPSLRSIMQIV